MAVSSIGSTFCVTVDCTADAPAQATHTITVGRACQVLLIEIVFATVGGGATVQVLSDATGSAGFTDMFGGALNVEINNVALVAQSAATGAGAMVLSPTAGATLTSESGQLRIAIGTANSNYVARFICTAETPQAIAVTTT